MAARRSKPRKKYAPQRPKPIKTVGCKRHTMMPKHYLHFLVININATL